MKLDFKINKRYLLVHSLRQLDITPFSNWRKLSYKLWVKNRDISSLLEGKPEWIFLNNNPLPGKLTKDINDLISFSIKSSEFKKLHSETEKYLNFVKKQWQKNEKFVYTFLKKTLGIKLPQKTIYVLITHPKFRNGVAFSHHNTIGWGHSEYWKNYSTVYLTHEIMHILTKNYKGNFEILHALIELACDNELRILLNKKGKYFLEGKFSVGHNTLNKIKKEALPYWNKYLRTKGEKDSILTLCKKLEKIKDFTK